MCCLRYGKYTYPEVHHLNTGGHAGQKRRGDEYTIGLCAWHHRGVPGHYDSYPGPSLAKQPGKFRITFGSDDQLLAEQNNLIAQAEETATRWRKP